MAEPETALTAEQWQLDLIETTLLRVGSDGVDKKGLQEEVGLGTDDLRKAIAAAEGEGVLVVDGDRYKPGPAAGVLAQYPDAPAEAASAMAEHPPGEVPEADEPDEGGGSPAPEASGDAEGPPEGVPEVSFQAGDSFRTVMSIEVRWAAADHGEATDEGARYVARGLREMAVDGIRERYPDLTVTSSTETVEALKVRSIEP